MANPELYYVVLYRNEVSKKLDVRLATIDDITDKLSWNEDVRPVSKVEALGLIERFRAEAVTNDIRQ